MTDEQRPFNPDDPRPPSVYKETAGSIVLVPLIFLYIFSALIGAVYWAVHEDILNVVLSIFIPLYGSLTVILDLIG